MSHESMQSRRSADVLRKRAGTLNSLAWWVDAMRQPTKSQQVLMVWMGLLACAAAAGGVAAAVGGFTLHSIADSQDASHSSDDRSA
jgi:hypothetical protein